MRENSCGDAWQWRLARFGREADAGSGCLRLRCLAEF